MRYGTVLVEAPAKVNLHLGVGRLRADGYHEVETVLQAIGLVDRLTLRCSDLFLLSCEPDLGIPKEENLVWRAAMLFAQHAGREPNASIELVKAIPVGAGLGGGSSDAAAAIAGLATLWGLDAHDEPLLHVARALGADVAFFLEGGTALYTGRGDVFVRRIDAPEFHIVVVKPSESVNTAAAYARFDRAPIQAPEPDALIAACESGDAERVAAALSNNMELAAVALVPEVADALAYLRGADGVLGGAVAGSGSAVFGICADAAAAERAARTARERGWWSVATMSRESGASVQVLEGAQ